MVLISLLPGATITPTRFVNITKEALATNEFEHRPGIYEETFGECTLLMTQWLRSDGPRTAFESKWVRPGPENLHPCKMLSIMLGVEQSGVKFSEPSVYYEYPFGTRYVMALGLSVMRVWQLRLFYEVMSYLSLAALAFAAWRNSSRRALVFLPVPLVLTFGFAQHGYAHNLAAAPQYISLFLILAAMLWFREWFVRLSRRLFAISILGTLHYYLDTNFTMAFAMSLALVVNHLFYGKRDRCYGRAALIEGAAVLVCFAACFAVSFALHIALMRYLNGVGWDYFSFAAGHRLSSVVDGAPITIWDTVTKLSQWVGQLTGGTSTAIVLLTMSALSWVAAFVMLARRPSRDLLVDLAVLLVAAGGVFAWYVVALNHTHVHAFITVRILALPIAYGFVALILAMQATEKPLRLSPA